MKKKPTLYIRRSCPWCREAMAFFSQHGIELDVRDVEASKQNMDRMVEVSEQGYVPTFEYGEFIVSDFSVDEFQDALEQHPEVRKELGIGDDED